MSRWISVMLILLVVFAFSGCDELTDVSGGTVPPSSVTADPSATATDAASQTSTPEASDTATASPSATTEGSASPQASASPTPSPSPTGKSGALSVSPVVGKAKVENTLTLRSTAASDGTSIAEIPKDAELTVLQVETGKKWLKVEYEGKKGYVQAKYVSVGNKDSDRVCTVFCDSVLNVRRGAGTKYDVIGFVDYGVSLVVKSKATASGETWYKVEIGDLAGYISAKYCRIAEN